MAWIGVARRDRVEECSLKRVMNNDLTPAFRFLEMKNATTAISWTTTDAAQLVLLKGVGNVFTILFRLIRVANMQTFAARYCHHSSCKCYYPSFFFFIILLGPFGVSRFAATGC